MKTTLTTCLFLASLAVVPSLPAQTRTSASYTIQSDTIDSAGGPSRSASYSAAPSLRSFGTVPLRAASVSTPTLPSYEPFDHPAGPLIGMTAPGGGTWVAAGPAGTGPIVVAESLINSIVPPPIGNRVEIQAMAGPGARLLLGTNLNSGILHCSLLLKVENLGGINTIGTNILGFDAATNATPGLPNLLAARVFLRAAGNGYNVGLSKTAANPALATWDPRVFSTTDTLLLVVAYNWNQNNAALWILESTQELGTVPPPPTLVNAAGGAAPSIASFSLIPISTNSFPASVSVDELRIGTQWTEVVAPSRLDYGDAPAGYPVLRAENGARHRPSALRLGTAVDPELDGRPSPAADGDDLAASPDDEDGVILPDMLLSGTTMPVTVVVSGAAAGLLDVWVDWNRDLDWSDTGEHVRSSYPVIAGTNTVFLEVPADATRGLTTARFRLSVTGTPAPTGYAPNGEVEDYRVNIQPPLSIALSTGPLPVTAIEGELVTFSLSVSNLGSQAAADVALTGSWPEGFQVQSVLASQGACDNGGAGLDCGLGILQPQGTAIVTVSGILELESFALTESVNVTNEFTVSASGVELTPADNTAPVVVGVVLRRDWGDAPETYHTLGASNGPRHRIRPGWRLGMLVDPDLNGMPSANSDGDDMDDGTDDEDGVIFLTPIIPGLVTSNAISITVPPGSNAFLNAWFDFNRDGTFAGAFEHVIADLPVSSGVITPSFLVPLGALAGSTHARFRLSAAPSLTPDGFTSAGEVEDYGIECKAMDFGDLPNSYRTTKSADGARHLVGSQLYLGSNVDTEDDGVPSASAQGDDLAMPLGFDDETGVSIAALVPGSITRGITVQVTTIPEVPAFLDAWIDWNRDGDFEDSGEKVFHATDVVDGANTLSCAVPVSAVPGGTYARFRLSLLGGLDHFGYAASGEVEDYQVIIQPPAPVAFGGLRNSPLGQAVATVESNELTIANIGSSGEDGVSIDLQEVSRTARLRMAPINLSSTAGATVRLAADGMVNDAPDRSFGSLELRNTGNTVQLWWPDDTCRLVEVYDGAQRVGSVHFEEATPLGMFGTLSGQVQLIGVTAGDATPQNEAWTLWELEFAEPVVFTPTSGPALTGTRIRLVMDHAPGALQNLARLSVTAGNVGTLRISEVDAPHFRPRLRLNRIGQQLDLKWDTRRARLEKASTTVGPWSPVTEDTNAVMYPTLATNEFFRVRLIPIEFCDLGIGFGQYVCQRNVLLVIADDVGVDQIPLYRNYYNATSRTDDDITHNSSADNPATFLPTVARLAAAGVTFVNAWSSPSCSPTRAGLFTGTRSFRHGVYRPTMPDLPTSSTTIAQVLKASEYQNGLFGKWHLGDDSSHLPTAFGWDWFEGSLGGEPESYYAWTKTQSRLDGPFVLTMSRESTAYATTENVDDALDWIRTQTDPWMATVAFNAPHWAGSAASEIYEAPPAGCAYQIRSDPSNRAKYRSMLECLDHSLSNLLAGIDTNVLAQTTIIFMGDNGTEGDITDHFLPGDEKSKKSKGSLYEGGSTFHSLSLMAMPFCTASKARGPKAGVVSSLRAALRPTWFKRWMSSPPWPPLAGQRAVLAWIRSA